MCAGEICSLVESAQNEVILRLRTSLLDVGNVPLLEIACGFSLFFLLFFSYLFYSK